jgi:hypothetical protein
MLSISTPRLDDADLQPMLGVAKAKSDEHGRSGILAPHCELRKQACHYSALVERHGPSTHFVGELGAAGGEAGGPAIGAILGRYDGRTFLWVCRPFCSPFSS